MKGRIKRSYERQKENDIKKVKQKKDTKKKERRKGIDRKKQTSKQTNSKHKKWHKGGKKEI